MGQVFLFDRLEWRTSVRMSCFTARNDNTVLCVDRWYIIRIEIYTYLREGTDIIQQDL